MGIKQLPPSQRKSYRYLKFRVHSDKNVDTGEIVDAVWTSVLKFLGSKGAAETDFWLLGDRFDEEKQEGVIKVRRERVEELRASMTLINEFSGEEGFIEVRNVSGSLKSLN